MAPPPGFLAMPALSRGKRMIVVAELVVWALYMPSYSLIPNARGFSGLHSMTDPVTLPAINM
jgi:hypothetical protein